VSGMARRRDDGATARREQPVIGGQPLFGLFNKLALSKPAGNEAFVVQILGARPKVGATSIARALAEFAALNVDGPVALVDADPFELSQFRLSGTVPAGSLQDVQNGRLALNDVRAATGFDNLSLLALADMRPAAGRSVTWTLSIGALQGIVASLRSNYAWVIVDSAPVQESAFTNVVARFADGTVVVAESEKTRVPVAQRIVQQVRDNGGTPLGLVINKRKLLISDFLYRFL
jgi:Mrp family chromosome partitioning ATPase